MNENKNKLKEVSQKFISDTFFVPIVGAEIEFSLENSSVSEISEVCNKQGVDFLDVQKEEGENQWEVTLSHKSSPVLIADELMKIRKAFKDADFSAKPLADGYGNALHIHISLLDKKARNIFEKNGEEESQHMQYAVGGLLEKIPEYINVFAPYDECYERFKGGKNAPSTISWGGNNRTVALRLPATTLQNHNRRIEHRVSSADANPYLVISAILDGVSYGILNKVAPSSEKMYGDASLDMYGLPKLF